MIYMSPQNNIAGRAREFGQMLTPKSGRATPRGIWCADNGVFTGQYRFGAYFSWLWAMRPYRGECAFVPAPDVVSDARATRLRYWMTAPLIKAMGYPVAYVAQDDQENMAFPPMDAVFIGGSTDWKMSPAADACIRAGQASGAWVHVGRVNSIKRIRHFKLVGVDSVDGTALTYAPDVYYRLFGRALKQNPLMEI